MQTFLPYPDFKESAKCLDMRRLGKQRVEAYQLLSLMIYPEKNGWRRHPAFLMWDGYDIALCYYGLAICNEWISRGYRDSIKFRIEDLMRILPYGNADYPYWLGDESFHAAHRSNLLRKDWRYYSRFGWDETNDLPYIWPR